MEKIASFTIDHLNLLSGIYVSRRDFIGKEVITTFDLRMTRPNFEEVMDIDAMHALEHIIATYLRNHKIYKDKIIYFGPMGCRTGFYLLLAGDLESKDIIELIKESFEFSRDFIGDIPGATPKDCGNYKAMNLKLAKKYSKKYLEEVLYNINDERLIYPK